MLCGLLLLFPSRPKAFWESADKSYVGRKRGRASFAKKERVFMSKKIKDGSVLLSEEYEAFLDLLAAAEFDLYISDDESGAQKLEIAVTNVRILLDGEE